ncbi:hypothetical protein [Acinetobacter sp. YH12085]|uniref:hypothetical protein n=1 Tax=Acinetobacter sp. YH12085 TaxID=2601077 RepID=UPI0015D10AC3|nr:hypothetical protein [Acinetobacter sp. YH12085]
MISKQFKLMSSALAVLGVAAFIYFQYQMRPEVLGGYKDDTEQYFGYRYARDNQLKSADQCDDEKDDPEMNVNAEFVEGCIKYFEERSTLRQ